MIGTILLIALLTFAVLGALSMVLFPLFMDANDKLNSEDD
jgi:hypothetical protein